MSDRIVSWRINDSEPRVSPSLSTVSSASGLSVLSINSIGSDTHTMTTEATRVQRVDLRATKLTNLTPSANPTTDDSFVRHDIYFFKDGNITFLVDGTLYCVHRYFFCRDSAYFSSKLVQLDVRDHEPLNTIISLGDVERKDFEAFLSVIYPENFEEHDLSYEQWKSVLNLSTRWGFASLRNLALRSIKPPTAFDQLLLARTYNVDHWVLPALSALCKRKRPTSAKEARQMSIEDIVVVATVREEIRSQRPFVNTAEIERRIEAAQVKVVAYVDVDVDDDDDDDDDDLESEGEAGPNTNSKGGGESAAYPYPVSIGRHPPVSGQPMGKSDMVKPVSPTTSRPPTPIPVPAATSRPPSPKPSTPTMSRPAASVAATAATAPIAPNMGQSAATSTLGQGSEKKDGRTRKISNQRVPTSGRGLSVASTSGSRGLWSGMNGVNGGSG